MITKLTAIKSLLPTAQVALDGDVVTWVVEPITKPTEAEINAEVARLTALEPNRIANQNRRAAYIAESDSLFFKAQRGEATIQEWQNKVAEIKARFPYQE